ncbi:MAG: hypothetical protein HY791_35985 [Deltaproteobacteria bacterium]|nr:hypothetical protein [Deltaproteobacteria bacterium]
MRIWSILGSVTVLVAPSVAFAQVARVEGQAGIVATPHNLGNNAVVAGRRVTASVGEDQICKFCHSPHFVGSTQLLWNRNMSFADLTFGGWGQDLDGNALTTTLQGTTLPTGLLSPSRRCLSCHDGTIAVGDLKNAGGGVAGVLTMLGAGQAAGMLTLMDVTVTNLGGNHPISIPYGKSSAAYNGITTSVPASDTAWWAVDTTATCVSTTGICTSAPATAPLNGPAINLYRGVGVGGTGEGVECSTCHEPHNKYGNPFFLRVSVTDQSGLCRSCHNK